MPMWGAHQINSFRIDVMPKPGSGSSVVPAGRATSSLVYAASGMPVEPLFHWK